MRVSDAASILGLTGELSPELIKTAYRKACAQYHPDRNPAGLEMMKAVNAAYEALKDYQGTVEETNVEYGDSLNEALNFAMGLAGVEIEICGSWIWLSGETRTHKEAIKQTKETFADGNGYRWAPEKKRWYYRPADWKGASRGNWSMDEIRDAHGSTTVKSKQRKALAV